MTRLTGFFLTPDGFVDGELLLADDGRIARIDGDPVPEAAVRASCGTRWLPGFVDLHVHGGGGRDVMDGGDAAVVMARAHAARGTTSLLATTMTAPPDELEAALRALAPVCRARAPGAARVLGVHLEGPYLSAARLGAQPDCTRPFDAAEVARLHALAPIRLVTLAPEVDGHFEAVAALVRAGHRVQIGHSQGRYEDGVRALACGACGFTHLFNAMTPLHHRDPGLVGAALAHATSAELIADLLHVHAGAIRVALRAIPRLYCVSDATAAAGMPDGEYRLGRQRVTRCLGGVRLADGTLAGSTLMLDQALRNLVDVLGLDLADASRRVSTYPADHLGLADRGRLVPGAWGDLVALDAALRPQAVRVEGEAVDVAHAS